MLFSNYINFLSLKYSDRPLNTIELKIIDLLQSDFTIEEIATECNYSNQHTQALIKSLCGLVAQETRLRVNKKNIVGIVDNIIKNLDNIEEFRNCHALNKVKVTEFNQNTIRVDLGTFWRFDAINNCLVLKHQYPVIVNLSGLGLNNVGNEILKTANRDSVSPYALQELCQILYEFFR
jgi:hypothetical protein